ncbi:MAG: ATP-binding protein [Candidatus Anstonellales archaeon]
MRIENNTNNRFNSNSENSKLKKNSRNFTNPLPSYSINDLSSKIDSICLEVDRLSDRRKAHDVKNIIVLFNFAIEEVENLNSYKKVFITQSVIFLLNIIQSQFEKWKTNSNSIVNETTISEIIKSLMHYCDIINFLLDQNGIKFHFILDISIKNLFLKIPIDEYSFLFVILNNLISNSINSLQKQDKQINNKEISLQISIIHSGTSNSFVILVQDNGVGFSDEAIEAFYSKNRFTTNKNTNDHGFGLYNIRELVEKVGGKVNIFNDTSGRANVEIAIPILPSNEFNNNNR